MKPMPFTPFCRCLPVVGAVVVGWAIWGTASVEAQAANQRKLSAGDRGEIQILSRTVDDVAKGQISAPTEVGLYWGNQFLKAPDNLVYVPYTISLDGDFQSDVVLVYVRAVDRNAPTGEYDQSKVTMGQWRNMANNPGQAVSSVRDVRANAEKSPWAFEDALALDAPLGERLTHALWVPPGEYDIYVAMRGRGRRGKTAILTQPLEVPEYTSEFSISSVIVADRLEPDEEAGDAQGGAFSVDGLRITPQQGGALSSDGTLNVVFWIYNEQLGSDGAPNLEVDYSFYRLDGTTAVFFNRTRPKQFTVETVPADFDLAAGHQILAAQSVPLATFPEGDYRLTIRVQDHVGENTITRELPFSVVPSP